MATDSRNEGNRAQLLGKKLPAVVFCDFCEASISAKERRYRTKGKVACTSCAAELVGRHLAGRSPTSMVGVMAGREMRKAGLSGNVHRKASSARPANKWRRASARWIDWALFAIVSPLLLSMLNLPFHLLVGLPPAVQDLATSMVLFALFVPVEAGWLARYGTTPGKWFFGLRIADTDGDVLTHEVALRRSFHVWWRGCGCGFPLASLATLWWSERQFDRGHEMPWDAANQTRVTYQQVSPFRQACGVALIVVVLVSYGIAQ